LRVVREKRVSAVSFQVRRLIDGEGEREEEKREEEEKEEGALTAPTSGHPSHNTAHPIHTYVAQYKCRAAIYRACLN
jgi:hypothetical protein